MGRTAYLDCFSGISGDMMLGALLDLGLPIGQLEAALGSLALDHGGIRADRVLRAGVSATKFRLASQQGGQVVLPSAHDHGNQGHHAHAHEPPHVHVGQGHAPASGQGAAAAGTASHGHHHHPHHSLDEIMHAISRSSLSAEGKARASGMFTRLAEAEAAIHEIPVSRIHLHEVGALDSIVDIVGVVHGMEWLQAAEITASPLNVGSGTVVCAHGTFPVPAPATARLLTGVPVYAGPVAAELVTPTGALIVTEYAGQYGPLPAMTLDKIGYGAGSRDTPGTPNVLRVLLGEGTGAGRVERLLVIETEIDDMNPQLFGPLMDTLHAAGALDVYYAPVMMKKSRPGTLVTVLAPPTLREAITGRLFAETTTLGVRWTEVQRERLERRIQTVDTPAGPIRVKIASRDGVVMNAAPEFEDCARAASARGLPVKEVQAMATRAWLDSGAERG